MSKKSNIKADVKNSNNVDLSKNNKHYKAAMDNKGKLKNPNNKRSQESKGK